MEVPHKAACRDDMTGRTCVFPERKCPKANGKRWVVRKRGTGGAKVETLSGYVYPAKLPIGLGMDL